MLKHMLIPTDGSEFSEKVVRDGMALAKTLHAKVTGVHVFPSYVVSGFGEFTPEDEVKQLRERARAEGDKYLGRLEAAAKTAGVAFDRVIVENDHIWKAIVETAQKKGCDLIMMASHGRRGFAAVMIGSETQKVLTHSKIPVLVYR